MITGRRLPTAFLPPERVTLDEIELQQSRLRPHHPLLELLDVIPHAILVLNAHRQIVYANQAFQQLSTSSGEANALYPDGGVAGLRPGEALQCEHLSQEEAPGGCGTSPLCLHCGLAHAVQRSLKQLPATEECVILRHGPDGPLPLDLRVWSRPFGLETDDLIFVVAVDVSHERRRQSLEEIFFHDLGNTAGLIFGLSEMLVDESANRGGELARLSSLMNRAALRLMDEIEAQQQLADAEDGSLIVTPSPCSAASLIGDAIALLEGRPLSEGRVLTVDPASADVAFESDQALVSRVLVNMIKNALEATRPGETVTVGYGRDAHRVQFWVHNPSAMAEATRHQVFRRHFTTRGNGRGLGTYSMWLLTERYLGGSINFVSSRAGGTTFVASYPLHTDPSTESAQDPLVTGFGKHQPDHDLQQQIATEKSWNGTTDQHRAEARD